MPSAEKPGFRFPSAFTDLLALIIILVAGPTLIILVWQYDRVPPEAQGNDAIVVGSSMPTEANPRGIVDVALVAVAGSMIPYLMGAGACLKALSAILNRACRNR